MVKKSPVPGRKRAFTLCPGTVQNFEDVDFAIVGSGPAALGLAIRLRQEYPQQKIVLFEKNSNVGGGMHSFKLLGQTFESGTHYLGSGAVQAFQKLLPTGLCPAFIPLCSPEGCMSMSNAVRVYDSLRVNNIQVDLSSDHGEGGWDSWEKSYLLTFPEEEVRIRRFRRLLQSVSGLSAHVFFVLRALDVLLRSFNFCERLFQFCFPDFARLSKLTLLEVFLQCDIQPQSKLGTLLAAQGGNYGLPPSEASFLMHAAMVKHYATGGAFMPDGGPEALVQACVSHLQSTGNARLFMRAEVYRIVHNRPKGGYVLDVLKRKPNLSEEKDKDRVHERYRFKTKNLVVATSFHNVDGLVPMSPRSKFRTQQQGTDEVSGTFVFLFCTLRKREAKGNASEQNKEPLCSVLTSDEMFGNVWVHPVGWDLESAHCMRKVSLTGKDAPMSFLVSRRGMKITVIGTAEWTWCRPILNKGSVEDIDWRSSMTEKLLSALDRSNVIPVARGKRVRDYVDKHRLGTPLCIRKFLAAKRGNAYGAKHSPPRFCSIGNVTPCIHLEKNGDGLWRTGQDLVTAGVAGALASAEMTFFSIKISRTMAKVRDKMHWVSVLGGAVSAAVVWTWLL